MDNHPIENHKLFTGVVTSNKMANVITVEVAHRKAHPLYHKSIKQTKKYHVQNSIGAKVGDTVSFIETRPLSRTVYWKTVGFVTQQKVEVKKSQPKTNTTAKLEKPKKSSPKTKKTK